VVTNASTASYYPTQSLACHNVSKAALACRPVLALEAGRGVWCRGRRPGKIAIRCANPAVSEKTERLPNPMRRSPDREVADLVAFLASDQAWLYHRRDGADRRGER
jgi:NAD(P)-dependent dehydrogenase (short-subunit alcohol dehydrogenase family)